MLNGAACRGMGALFYIVINAFNITGLYYELTHDDLNFVIGFNLSVTSSIHTSNADKVLNNV